MPHELLFAEIESPYTLPGFEVIASQSMVD
ncbi:hypothetical protein MSIMFI_01008 [Mycobacterium simulans]|nr:hypothetical protein MSIMFI_01008 [Mycobacterium simulans]